jgi:FkbM family methyltransferase
MHYKLPTRAIKTLIKQFLKTTGIGITSYSNLQRLIDSSMAGYDIEFISTLPDDKIVLSLKNLKKSKSQIRQDLFVLSELCFKRNGVFVEFGATDGINLSNTFLLEKEFGWTGILAEPAKCWHNDLRKNRNCHIDTRCVWSDSDSTLIFNEVYDAGLSTIDRYSQNDFHKEQRENGKTYEVKTISLLDLLNHYSAPKQIDYLSIDTEGSEFEILSHFDFDKYEFKVITCEHNFTPMRENVHKLLTSKGYLRKFADVSQVDDWYVKM